MKPTRNEYNSGTTNAPNCYARMDSYGKQGYRPIIPPTPVSMVPALFLVMKPDRKPDYIRKF